MTKHLIANINPVALVWVRDVIGMPRDIAAKKIGVSENRLEAFEAGDAFPTVGQLRTIAKTYRRPAAFFYLEMLPEKPERIKDFRSLPDEHEADLPELLDAVEAARQRRLLALELADTLGYEVPEFGLSASRTDPPENLAIAIRERLGISLDEQRSWREQYRVLRGWITSIEQAGILVSQFSRVGLSAARGFSLSERPFPLIALNGKDYPRAKVFTLFHELAHIALGEAGLCDLHDDERTFVIEPFCNLVAAEALVPAAHLIDEPLVRQHDDEEWEEWRIHEIATSYGVSQEVILRRLLTLGRTSEAFYRAKREEYLQAYRDAAAGRGGFLEYFRRVLRDNGATFTNLVLDAYRADTVTPTEVSRFLGGIKLRHVSSIQDALDQGAS